MPCAQSDETEIANGASRGGEIAALPARQNTGCADRARHCAPEHSLQSGCAAPM